MVELLKDRPNSLELVTRRYPVDLQALQARLSKDLSAHYDAVLHLGQSPGATCIKLEAVALNVAGCVDESGEELPPILEAAPLAYRSRMPLGKWAQLLREHKIPTMVSYHAGTFLCNATMYLTHHWYYSRRLDPPVGFMHLPLTTEQVVAGPRALPSLSAPILAKAIHLVLEDLASSDLKRLPSQRLA